MVIDSNLVLMDSTAILGVAVTGNAVPLTSFLKPGREEPIPICAKVVRNTQAKWMSMDADRLPFMVNWMPPLVMKTMITLRT